MPASPALLEPAQLAPRARWLTVRDRRILTLAKQKLGPGTAAFEEAVRALREATEESIPSGRVFLLGIGARGGGPIVGSLVSGIGIAEADEAPRIVRVVDGRVIAELGWLR